jgi:cation/acetate symporter
VFSGSPTSVYPQVDFAWFPLQNPGVVSIPTGFLLGWLGSVLRPQQEPSDYEEFEIRTLAGAAPHGTRD